MMNLMSAVVNQLAIEMTNSAVYRLCRHVGCSLSTRTAANAVGLQAYGLWGHREFALDYECYESISDVGVKWRVILDDEGKRSEVWCSSIDEIEKVVEYFLGNG